MGKENHSDWTIILVEDNYDDVQVISKIFEHYSIVFHVASNGQECCDLLESVNPTAVVTDLAMPVMDGWETLQALRQHPDYHNVPVIAVTAYSSPEVAEEARKMKFDGYFTKPIEPIHFIEQLAIIIASQ